MHDPNKNKMANVNLHFASVSESEILRNITRYHTRKYKEGYGISLESFQRMGKTYCTDVQILSSFKTCPWESQISSI